MSNNGNQKQEMLHKPQKQKNNVDELKMGGNGEDGDEGPFVSYSFSSSSSQIVCEPDPLNPGQQICKRVTKSSSRDPSGKTSTRESEQEIDSAPGLFGGRPRNPFFGNQGGSDDQNGFRPDGYYRPSLQDRAKDKWQKFKNLMNYGEENEAPVPQISQEWPSLNPFAHSAPTPQQQQQHYPPRQFQPPHPQQQYKPNPLQPSMAPEFQRLDPFEEMERQFFGQHAPFSAGIGGHHDPFERMGPHSLIDQIEKEFFGEMPSMRQSSPFENSQSSPFSTSFGMGPAQFAQFQHPGQRQPNEQFQNQPNANNKQDFLNSNDPRDVFYRQNQNPNRAAQSPNQQQQPQTFVNSDDPRDVFRNKNYRNGYRGGQ